MKKRFLIIALFSAISMTVLAQLPQEFIMGKLTMDAGRFNYSGIFDTQADKASSSGMFLKHSLVFFNENNYSEIGSDVPLVSIIQLINGVKNISRLSFTEVPAYEEVLAGTPEQGNQLFYRHLNIISLSQSFKVYEDFMIGYYAGGEGVVANEVNANLVLTDKKTLDVSYWALGPVLAYQKENIRVETTIKYFLGKKVSNGKNLTFKADYYLSNRPESLSLALGIYANKVWFGKAKFEDVPQVNVSSIGLSVSVLYPSIWNLVKD